MEFVVTGTHSYGPAKPESDLDIVLMKIDVLKMHRFLASHNIEIYQTPSQDIYQDKGGFYFDLSGIKINIIVAIDEENFKYWKDRTEKMRGVPPIEDRQERIDIFNNTLDEGDIPF